MVGTIGFAGGKAKVKAELERWWLRLGLPHTLASVLGGALLGTLVGLLGALTVRGVGRLPVTPIALALFLLAVGEAAGAPPKYLSSGRQVPMNWKYVFPPTMSATLYGGLLGVGVGTKVYFWNFYALLVMMFVVGDVGTATLGGAAFGLARVFPVLLSPLAPNAERLDELVDRVSGFLDRRNVLTRLLSASITGAAGWAFIAKS